MPREQAILLRIELLREVAVGSSIARPHFHKWGFKNEGLQVGSEIHRRWQFSFAREFKLGRVFVEMLSGEGNLPGGNDA